MRRCASFWLALAGAVAGLSAASAGADAERVHEVKAGETLWQIAGRLTGDPHRWPELYRANRDQIKDPSTLYPGQRLAIPDFDAAPGSGEPSAKPPAAESPGPSESP